MNIIFLDIDGVLNSPETKEKIGHIKGVNDEKIALLREVVDYTGSKIVLTSTWKDYWAADLDEKMWTGPSKLRYGRYLNAKLKNFGLRIIDKTEEEHWTLRPLGVRQWLDSHDIENFIILDDEDFNWRARGFGDHWVNTDYRNIFAYVGEGLTPKKVEQIKKRFNNGDFKNNHV